MIDRIINTKNINEADTVILSAPYEGGVSFMGGTAEGPAKIKSCLDQNLELYNLKYKCEPAKKLKTAHLEITDLAKLSPEHAVDKIKEGVAEVYDKNKFTILWGGEHTVSLGALKAIALKENPKDITILQIDAHQDLRDTNADYDEEASPFAHSCVMRRAHELGYNFVQVGIRTFSKYEYEYTQANKKTIKVFQWDKDSKIPKISEIIKSIKTKKVYVSIDVDGFDPGCMPGTGTPVPGGLAWNYGLDLLEQVFAKKEVVAADIVEVAPMQDSVLTEWNASYLTYTMMADKFAKKLK